MSNPPLLEITNLKTYFPIERGVFSKLVDYVKAVDGVTLTIREGETIGLVGESGCGKSTLGRTLVDLYSPLGGSVVYEGADFSASHAGSEKVQMVFQDPYGSLNPRMTAGAAIAEVVKRHRSVPESDVLGKVKELFSLVELSPDQVHRYPHEFSGGQRQRIGIARALAAEPKLIVCDEIVSALDVSVQAQIINLLRRLQAEKGLAYLFISHDLAVVRQIAHRVAVMYCGRIVECGDVDSIMSTPLHPYTQALIATAGRERKVSSMIPGEVANPADPPGGCYFHPRCALAGKGDEEFPPHCVHNYPDLDEKRAGHLVACHLVEKELPRA